MIFCLLHAVSTHLLYRNVANISVLIMLESTFVSDSFAIFMR